MKDVKFLTDEHGNKEFAVIPIALFDSLMAKLGMSALMQTSHDTEESESDDVSSVSKTASRVIKIKAIRKMLPEQEIVTNTEDTFHFKVKNVLAYGFPSGKKSQPQFTILKNSTANIDEVGSLRAPVRKLKNNLIEQGVLVLQSDCYVFTENYTCNSTSFAASLIAGNNRSGPEAWINAKGESLKDLGYGSKTAVDKNGDETGSSEE